MSDSPPSRFLQITFRKRCRIRWQSWFKVNGWELPWIKHREVERIVKGKHTWLKCFVAYCAFHSSTTSGCHSILMPCTGETWRWFTVSWSFNSFSCLAIIPNNLIRLGLTQNLTPCHLSSCQKCAIPWSPWFRSSESCETLSCETKVESLCQIVAKPLGQVIEAKPQNRQKERPWSMCFMWFQHNPVEMAPSTSQTGIPSSVVVSGGTAWQYSISSQDRNMFAAKTLPQFWFLEKKKQKDRPRRSFWHRHTNFSKNFPKVHAALLPGRVSFSTVQKLETWPNEASPCPNGTMEQQPTDSENWSRLQEHPCSQQLSHQLKFAYCKFIQIHNIKQTDWKIQLSLWRKVY